MAKRTKDELDAAAKTVMSSFDTLPDDAHVRVRHVAAVMGCSVATVWRARKAGTIPAPHRITTGIVAWRVGDLRQALRGVA